MDSRVLLHEPKTVVPVVGPVLLRDRRDATFTSPGHARLAVPTAPVASPVRPFLPVRTGPTVARVVMVVGVVPVRRRPRGIGLAT